MKTDILATAAALSDQDLLAHLSALAGREREACVELVAHLAALDSRPSVFLERGFGSLHAYCTQALGLSEDAACNRIEAARACRRFPVILGLLASGEVTLTSVRLLRRHLTPENHRAVLDKAKGRTLKEIDLLVAALAPQPDAPSLVRRLPIPAPPSSTPVLPVAPTVPSESMPLMTPPLPSPPRPTVRPTAPERYRVQFTIGEATHEKLRRLQTLLRREIPDGDPGAIFDRAVTLLLAQVESRKLGVTPRPRSRPPIRRATDVLDIRTPPPSSRYVPMAVRRAVSRRDGNQCAFVSTDGRRCTERAFLEFHHLDAYAKQGPATVENLSLRCGPHNRYEGELVFGPRPPRPEREDGPPAPSEDPRPVHHHAPQSP